jgi:hypothetical protein
MKTTNKKISNFEYIIGLFEPTMVLIVMGMYYFLGKEALGGDNMYPYLVTAYIFFIMIRILIGIIFKFQEVINDLHFLVIAFSLIYFEVINNITYLNTLMILILSIPVIRIIYKDFIQETKTPNRK